MHWAVFALLVIAGVLVGGSITARVRKMISTETLGVSLVIGFAMMVLGFYAYNIAAAHDTTARLRQQVQAAGFQIVPSSGDAVDVMTPRGCTVAIEDTIRRHGQLGFITGTDTDNVVYKPVDLQNLPGTNPC